MRIVPLIVEPSGAPFDTENCRSPVSVPENRSVEVCPCWVTVTGSVGNDVSTASTTVVSAPAIWSCFTVNLLFALSGALVLTIWEMGSSVSRSEEHTSELQSLAYLVCRLLLEKKKNTH